MKRRLFHFKGRSFHKQMCKPEQDAAKFTIGGDVGAGSAIDGGEVKAENIAGRDIFYDSTVLQQIALSDQDARLEQLSHRLTQYAQGLVDALDIYPTSAKAPQPYPGLIPYTLEQHAQFFGRQELIKTLINNIAVPEKLHDRVWIIYGEPGVGKTSLVQAGLQPHLIRQGYLPFYFSIWRQLPDEALHRFLFADATTPFPLLHLLVWIAQVTNNQRLYFIFDQFEAFFGLDFDNHQRAQFIAILMECLRARELDVVFIFVVRTGQYAGFNAFKPGLPSIFKNEQEVLALSRDDAHIAITHPLTHLPHPVFESDLVDGILTDLDNRGIHPMQLQIVCDTLWDHYQKTEKKTLSLATYQDMGYWRGIVRQYLQFLLTKHIKPQYQDLTRAILVTLSSTEKEPVTKSYRQLARSLGDSAELKLTLQELQSLDLIYADKDAAGEPVYALSYHYLVKVIDLDAEAMNRKLAEEWLETGIHEFERHQFHLNESVYQFIKKQVKSGVLAIPSEAQALWRQSRKVSMQRNLAFQVLLVGLLGTLLFIPDTIFSYLTLRPGLNPEDLLLRALIAALGGAILNSTSASTLVLLNFWFSEWSQKKQLVIFTAALFVPAAILSGLAGLAGPAPELDRSQILILILLGIPFLGLAYQLSLLLMTAKRWPLQMRAGLIVGPIAGLLLAAAADMLIPGLLPSQRNRLWYEIPIYVTTLLTTFTIGVAAARRLVLNSSLPYN